MRQIGRIGIFLLMFFAFGTREYADAQSSNRVQKLIERLEAGKAKIKWDKQYGWLPDLLKQLDVPTTSQTLVFSKTSMQHRKIDPTNPRAIYFNDDVYVGFVPSGDVIEIAAVDNHQGAAFYTLKQKELIRASIELDRTNCLACHESNKTQNVAGFLVRSVFPKSSGHPEFRFGTTHTDHRTEFTDRFGGWYVTGKHGKMRHRGNVMVDEKANDEKSALRREQGANLSDLPKLARRAKHLEPTSDIVALMLLEHQTQFHNYVSLAAQETRVAIEYQREMNKILERDKNFQSDSTRRRIESVADKLVDYLFFKDEFQLTSPVQGSKKFQQDFLSRAVRDSKGRSLRDLDLEQRLLKFPCSYLVYTDSFCSLPQPVLKLVVNKMTKVLEGNPGSYSFKHLTKSKRAAILAILTETHPLFGGQQNEK